jgi:hypothetical protein
MRQRGRQSLAALTAPAGEASGAVTLLERPAAPLDLTPEETDEWVSVVDAMPADWFPRETHALLRQYVRHTVSARRVAQMIDAEMSRDQLDVGALDKMLQMQARETAALKALAASMRLAQQSARTDGAAGTAKRGSRAMKRPWESE